MSQLLRWAGWFIMILGVIGSIFISRVPVVRNSSLLGSVIESKFSWPLFIAYVIGSVLTGLIFLGLSSILQRSEENQEFLRELLHRTHEPTPTTRPATGNSRASLDSLKGFKMGQTNE